MEKIYSITNPNILLHLIVKKEDISNQRMHLCPESEYLHLSCGKHKTGQAVRPHKHLEQARQTNITQESWIVTQGAIRGYYYDLDDSLIKVVSLKSGDASLTFRGGHKYDCLEEDTIVYEHKTGPYLGQLKDKEFIDTKENV